MPWYCTHSSSKGSNSGWTSQRYSDHVLILLFSWTACPSWDSSISASPNITLSEKLQKTQFIINSGPRPHGISSFVMWTALPQSPVYPVMHRLLLSHQLKALQVFLISVVLLDLQHDQFGHSISRLPWSFLMNTDPKFNPKTVVIIFYLVLKINWRVWD